MKTYHSSSRILRCSLEVIGFRVVCFCCLFSVLSSAANVFCSELIQKSFCQLDLSFLLQDLISMMRQILSAQPPLPSTHIDFPSQIIQNPSIQLLEAIFFLESYILYFIITDRFQPRSRAGFTPPLPFQEVTEK